MLDAFNDLLRIVDMIRLNRIIIKINAIKHSCDKRLKLILRPNSSNNLSLFRSIDSLTFN